MLFFLAVFLFLLLVLAVVELSPILHRLDVTIPEVLRSPESFNPMFSFFLMEHKPLWGQTFKGNRGSKNAIISWDFPELEYNTVFISC